MKSKKQDLMTLGVDIGGTKVNTALVDADGNIVANKYQLIDPAKEPENVVRSIREAAEICQQRSGRRASAIGIGVAGQIDQVHGIVRVSPNLQGWHNVPLKAMVELALEIPAVINNDVRAITVGEWRHGAGQGIDDMVCLFVGTGIGGGVVSGGRLLEGCCNTAGELGHMTIVTGGRQCHCPNQGCFEAYAGGWAIAERAQEAVRADTVRGKLLLYLASDINSISSITVAQAYLKSDPMANQLVVETGRFLGAGLVSVVNAFNPCLLILGGGVIQGVPEYIRLAQEYVLCHALQTPVADLRIVMATLGGEAGVVGAAAMARSVV